MNMQAVVEMSIICAIHGIINLETKTLRFVTKKQVQIFLFLRYNFLNFLENMKRLIPSAAKTASSRRTKLSRTTPSFMSYNVFVPLYTNSMIVFVTESKLDLSVCTCSPSTCKQTDEIEVCVLNWRYSFVCPSTDIDPSSIGCPDWSVSVCDNH